MHDPAFLEVADRIGSRLCRDALWAGQRCNWLGWALDVVGASWSPVHRVQSANLYEGTAGIALFLGHLYRFTHDRLQRLAALGAINQAISTSHNIPKFLGPSFYSGATGIAWATIQLGLAFEDERMVRCGTANLSVAASATPNEDWVDVIGGSAGTIQALLAVAHQLNRPDLVEIAVRHGRMLLHCAIRSADGLSWNTLQGQSQANLCGYGHGASGIGCALLELWAKTGDDEYRHAGLDAFRYERSLFDPQHHNWPDLRTAPGSMNREGSANQGVQRFTVAWCHGAPGIGFARLRALELVKEADLLRELNEALQSTVSACASVQFPSAESLCLCHGLGGNADLLLMAADLHQRPDLRQVAESVGHQAIAQVKTPDLPWPCGVTSGGETPNLMLGLSGIGHFFLRLYDSAQVPSLLSVRPEYSRHFPLTSAQAIGAAT